MGNVTSPESGTDEDRFFDDTVGPVALGLAYALVGIGLLYSVATGSVESFTAVLVGVLGLVAVSIYIVIERKGVRTAENKAIGIFVLVAMGLLFGLREFTRLSSDVVFGVVFAVGVIVPPSTHTVH